jgi:hypothetical protein
LSSIEPGYLRYVVDALQKGEINPDNASSLPEGLNGLFEQRFNEKIPSDQRLNKLKVLLCWSIVKAPMTSGSFARLFAYPHQEASDFIREHASWFNANINGEYSLYHDRLRTFSLQRSDYAVVMNVQQKIVHCFGRSADSELNEELKMYKYRYYHHHLGDLGKLTDASALVELEKLAFSDEFLLQQKTQTGSRKSTDELFRLLFVLHQGNVEAIERIFVRYLQVITGLPSSGMSLEELCRSDVKTFQRELERAFIQQQYASITSVLIVQLLALKNEAEKATSLERLTRIDQLLLQFEDAVQPLTTLLTSGLSAKTVNLIQDAFQSIDEFPQLKKLLQIASFDKQEYFDKKSGDTYGWEWLTTNSFWAMPLLIMLIPISFLVNVFTIPIVWFQYLRNGKAPDLSTFRIRNSKAFMLWQLGYFYTFNVIKSRSVVLSFLSRRLAKKENYYTLLMVASFQFVRKDCRCITQIRLGELSSTERGTVKRLRRALRSYSDFRASLKKKYHSSEELIPVYNILDAQSLDQWFIVGWMKLVAFKQSKDTYRTFTEDLENTSLSPVKFSDKLEGSKALLNYLFEHESDVDFAVSMFSESKESFLRITSSDRLRVLCEFSYQNSAEWLISNVIEVWNNIGDFRLLTLGSKQYSTLGLMTYRSEILPFSNISKKFSKNNYPLQDLFLIQLALNNLAFVELLDGDWSLAFPELAMGEFFDDEEAKSESTPTVLESIEAFFSTRQINPKESSVKEQLELLEPEPDEMFDSGLFDSGLYHLEDQKFTENLNTWHFFMDYSTVDLFEQLTEFGDSERKVMAVHMARNLYRCGSFDDFWHRLIVFQVGDDDEILRAGMRYYYDRVSKGQEGSQTAQQIHKLLGF